MVKYDAQITFTCQPAMKKAVVDEAAAKGISPTELLRRILTNRYGVETINPADASKNEAVKP